MADYFADKIILVTGASSGMGRATAIELGRRGAVVICSARHRDRGHETLAALRGAGGEGDFVEAELGDEASLDALFEFIRRKHGRLDGAFNNAGTELAGTALPDIAMADFDRVMAVNVRGTFICMRHELAMMRAQRSGSVVNTSSVAGVMGIRGYSAYCGSKHAVVGMTKGAALDMAAYGVRVNVICPGSIETEMMRRATNNSDEAIQRRVEVAPMKRMGRPMDIADAATWPMSDAAAYVTGLVMEIYGGVSAGLNM